MDRAPAELLFDLRCLRRSFAPTMIARGQNYQRERRVFGLSVSENGARFSAKVLGSRSQPYTVDIRVRKNPTGEPVLYGYCTCPVGVDCKHVVAVAFEALDLFPGAISRLSPGALGQDPADGAVEAWLEELEEIAGSRNGRELAQKEAQLLYIVDVRMRAYTPDFDVAAGVARRRKDGSFGTLRPYALQNLGYTTASFTVPEDLIIGRLLGSLQGLGVPRVARLEVLATAFERMIATGRCYWQSTTNPPLSRGAHRVAQLSWTIDSDGRQRPAVAGGGLSLTALALLPPWYVDTVTWQAGPLDLGLPPTIAAAILRAPSLAPSQVPRLRRTWEVGLAGLAVPAPRAAVEALTIEDDPVVHLSVTMQRVTYPATQRWSGGLWHREPARSLDVPAARLAFDYGGTLVHPSDAPDELRLVDGETLRLWPRRFAFEQNVRSRLESYEFAPLLDPQSGTAMPDLLAFPEPNAQERWARFVDRLADRLRSEGWQIDIDPAFPHRVIHLDAPWQAELHETQTRWFELGLDVDVDGQRIALLPAIVDAVRRLPATTTKQGLERVLAQEPTLYARLPDGTCVALPTDRVRSILLTLIELLDGGDLTADGRLPVTLAHAVGLDDMEVSSGVALRGGERLRAFARALRDGGGIQEKKAPRGLSAELRPYQATGFAWLQFLRKHELGGVLADDMGLGKTIQALAHIVAEKQAGRLRAPCLVVAPTSVVPNWMSEIARFAPKLRAVALQGPNREENFVKLDEADIVVTSYPLLLRDAKTLLPRQWQIAILDEAQAIKNPLSKGAKLAWQLKAKQRLALTGTPVENHLDELWSIFTFVMPGLLGGSREFRRLFRTPIEKHHDVDRRELLGLRLRPFMLRRTKAQVAQELPPKTEILCPIELIGSQRDLYEAVRFSTHEAVVREVERRGLARSRIAVLTALLKLRQVCCDPRLVKTVAARNVKHSAKLEFLMEMLPELLEEGRRVLLFSQFTSMLDLIKPELLSRKIDFVELRGDTTDRQTPVARFQKREVPLFLISLKAGGTGLNLTAADTVIHYDPWWNPAVERQATDRAHRIGQDQHVFVYKLIALGTVEERIVEMQARKGALAEGLFDPDRPATAAFTQEDIARLFAPLE